MNRPIEDLLRQAYAAKVEPITEQRLSQLSAARADVFAAELANDTLETGSITRLDTGVMPVLTTRRPTHSRWLAPALAAAAVVVVAAGAVAIANSQGHHSPQPAPPATRVSHASPTPSTSGSPKPSTSGSTPAATGSHSSAGVPAGYLGRGKTGARADVPWSVVGTGWRLLQPIADGTRASSDLYLYDPAGGRYLITDKVPANAMLTAWSPDGQRAMLQTSGDYWKFQQVDLRSGRLLAGFSQYLGGFVSYTQPHGLAVLVRGQVQGAERLLRYSPDGTMQLAYPPQIDGVGPLKANALYTPDGTQFLGSAGNYSVLISNDGKLVRKYPLPNSAAQSCSPVKWWTSGVFLEGCTRPGPVSQVTSLYLQPVSGGAASVLVDRDSATHLGYSDAASLSNGDVLLTINPGCGSAGYDILRPDGSIVALKLPAGVPSPGAIVNMSGDLATFLINGGCDSEPHYQLLDYDMVTGKTFTLNSNGSGVLVNFPGDN